MAKNSLYLDEHIQSALADALRARGTDVLTTQEAKNIGLGDSNQLIFAAKSRRSLLSYNKRHFAKIHYEWMNLKKYHDGLFSQINYQ